MSGRNIKLGLAAGVAGFSLLAGGLLFGSTLVSAQEPTPPATEEAAPTTPQDRAPSDDGTERTKPECDKDGDGQPDGAAEGDTTGIRFRGGARSFAQ